MVGNFIKSFYDWCIENNRQDILDRWDYILNQKKPNEISYKSHDKWWLKCNTHSNHESELFRLSDEINACANFQCRKCNSFAQHLINEFGDNGINQYWSNLNTINPWDVSFGSKIVVKIKCQLKDYHDDYSITCYHFSKGERCPSCKGFKVHYKDSFAQYHIDNTDKDFLEKYWDFNLNKNNPWEIRPFCDCKIWIKCQIVDYHESHLTNCNNFTRFKQGCPYCCGKKVHPNDSFAQYHINHTDKDFLEKYWDYPNNNKINVNPWNISVHSEVKVYIKCQNKPYHGSSYFSACSFSSGVRCTYCSNRGTHYLDSLGYLFPKILNLWSEKNKMSPFEYSPNSAKKVWWKCFNKKHNDYLRSINVSNSCDFRCPECSKEQTDSLLQKKVSSYIEENYGYDLKHEYNCSIVPQHPKHKGSRGSMPFDNEVINLRLIIEVHGEQHYNNLAYKTFWKSKTLSPEEQLYKRKLYDRYKKYVAFCKGYFYLEIPYWTEKDEFYKTLIDNKISEILKLKEGGGVG